MSYSSPFDDDQIDLPPRAGGRKSAYIVKHPRVVDSEKKEELRLALASVERQVEAAGSPELSGSARIERLLAINTTIIMNLLKEALAENPDLDRAAVSSRALVAVKDTVSMIKDKHAMESVDSFNPRSPKFGIVFGWFLDLVHRVLSAHSDETTVSNFFSDLVTELSGWEERIERQFKGVAGKALSSLQSPFVEEIGEQLKGSAVQFDKLDSLNDQIARAESRLAHLKGEIANLE